MKVVRGCIFQRKEHVFSPCYSWLGILGIKLCLVFALFSLCQGLPESRTERGELLQLEPSQTCGCHQPGDTDHPGKVDPEDACQPRVHAAPLSRRSSLLFSFKQLDQNLNAVLSMPHWSSLPHMVFRLWHFCSIRLSVLIQTHTHAYASVFDIQLKASFVFQWADVLKKKKCFGHVRHLKEA